MEKINNILIDWLTGIGIGEDYKILITRIIAIIAILLIAFIIDRFCRKLFIPGIRKITSKTESTWDDHLLSDDVLKNLYKMITPIVTISLIPFVLINESDLRALIIKLCWIYIIILGIKLACSFISSLYAISSEHEKYKNHSLKGFFQMIKLVVICIGTIIIISTLINKNPLTILASLGAGTAILMLVFQDTIKGLVAGIQLMANDMLRPGDWITMPKYGADGDVLEVTLTTVKVRNWDQTITTVPTYSLINDSFQNWRGMFEAGGRRVKRSLNIDMNTIRFCTKQEMENYNQQPWMKGFKETGNEEVNLHIFRHYVDYYLRNHPVVSKDMTLLVRQLQPTPEGLPIELYFFSADTRWANYEQLQAEVFDHIIAKLHTFDLKVFQSPSGLDIKRN
ncbi:MAG: mechanosensitive ion channel [Bacteroidales bacterium]|nr:mechanosensitive ion channel [Bacteroidales bacterium]